MKIYYETTHRKALQLHEDDRYRVFISFAGMNKERKITTRQPSPTLAFDHSMLD
jgi:hypothetical protein